MNNQLIDNAIEAYERMRSNEDAVVEATERENFAIRQLREAQEDLDFQIGEAVADAIFTEATSKKGEGPLKGLAASSKGYGIILKKIENDVRQEHAPRIRQMEAAVDRATTARQQATLRFSGSRHGCDLLAAILNGHTHVYSPSTN